MTIVEAITKCLETGQKVRPVCWRTTNPDYWIEYHGLIFVECGKHEDLHHTLRLQLQHPDEFLGEWEMVDDA